MVSSVSLTVASSSKPDNTFSFSQDMFQMRLTMDIVSGFKHLGPVLGKELDPEEHSVRIVVIQVYFRDVQCVFLEHQLVQRTFSSYLTPVALRENKIELHICPCVEDPNQVVIITYLILFWVDSVNEGVFGDWSWWRR